MMHRIGAIAFNTFREAVRDRVLYNLVIFAILIVGSSLLVGQISIGVERLVLINLGLTAISLFGIVIAIFIGIQLVSKEIEKRTLYTVLAARPVRRWEFIVGKLLGLIGTLAVNAGLMAIGFFAALLYMTHRFQAADLHLLSALYLIVLQFVLITALALFFSTFTTPLMSAVFAFALFVIGTFAEDLRAFAVMAGGIGKYIATGLAYLVPNFAALNVISQVAHSVPVPGQLVFWNTVYVLVYAAAVTSAAVLIFERRNLK
ncbi:MAG TPA: ABC transporter permease subunit [Clostridia bacterium]|nr:ABC transporter permease subunit [Clostridia bacterium]